VPRPPNDYCENAAEALSLPFYETGTTVGSLSDAIDKCSMSFNNRGVWYTFAPSIDSFITVTTSAATFSHEIILFSGDSCDVAICNGIDQSSTYDYTVSSISFKYIAKAGTRYYVLVTGFDGPNKDAFVNEGTFTLNIEVSFLGQLLISLSSLA
jgi:hypothetical protein